MTWAVDKIRAKGNDTYIRWLPLSQFSTELNYCSQFFYRANTITKNPHGDANYKVRIHTCRIMSIYCMQRCEKITLSSKREAYLVVGQSPTPADTRAVTRRVRHDAFSDSYVFSLRLRSSSKQCDYTRSTSPPLAVF